MKKTASITEKISFLLLCILMIDCSIFGFAAWGEFGPLGSRMMIFFLCIMFAIPALIKNFKIIVRNKYFISVMIFAMIVLVAAIIGLCNEHRISLIVRDIKGFMCLAILPVAIILLNSKKRINVLMKCLMVGSTLVASYSIVALVIYLNDKPLFWEMVVNYSDSLFAYYGVVSYSIARLFYQSCLYLLCGCAFGLYFFMTEKKKTRWIYSIMIGICLFAALMTYTRSLYLAGFITAALLVLLFWKIASKEQKRDMFKCIGASVVVFCIILSIFGISTKTDYIRFAILRSASGMSSGENLDEDSTEDEITEEEEYLQQTEDSDNLREATLNGLYRNIKKSPIIGIGLGAEFKERPDGVNEYVYLDMISKMGIIGLFVYFIPFLIMLKRLWDMRNVVVMGNIHPLLFMSILIGFMIFSHFNPYMNGALGIFFYCCTIGCVHWLENEYIEKTV